MLINPGPRVNLIIIKFLDTHIYDVVQCKLLYD